MRRILFLIISAVFICNTAFSNEPDSAYIRAFATDKNNHRNGLHFSWSADGKDWKSIGNDFSFLKCDYADWGNNKRMYDPVLLQNADGTWSCWFFVDSEHKVVAQTSSKDLILWKPQDYFVNDGANTIYNRPGSAPKEHKVSWAFVQNLINHCTLTAYKNRLYSETTHSFAAENPDLKPLNASLSIDFDNKKKISENLIGVFFEDINYAADGGLYGELIQNRDFEYSEKDRKEWNNNSKWRMENGELRMDTVNPLHKNNPHYVVLENGSTLTNEGYDGIPLLKGEKYDFSIFARSKNSGKIAVNLIDEQGNKMSSEITLNINSKNWKKYNAVITANKTVSNAKLQITSFSTFNSQFSIDMVSLFPQKTFKNRKNGLRADLAQAIADLKPRFVRFPGGCVAHGNDIKNIYYWKNSIGQLEERKPDRNIWGYHETMGLGYFEYFQFCEDIGAEPLPVLAAGVPCQNTAGTRDATSLQGQQGGIPLSEMNTYIQDILDLIEWANGNKSSKWGKVRTDAGHPQPFNLKYIGIGNEDLISEVFKERFEMIFNAIKEKYPEITVIGTVGPFHSGSDYEFGWDFATKLNVPMIDEHYYVSPAWMIYNQDFYDKYDRMKSKVYLGEYAAHLAGRPNNIETALAEALHLCNVERNGDVVSMTSYAPLLAKEGHTQWNPDLIYFNNTEVKPTVGYYVQKLFGNNAGDEYIASTLNLDDRNEKLWKRLVSSVVRDTKSGDIIIKLVNLLLVAVQVNLNVESLDLNGKQAVKTVLQGKPEDKNVLPMESRIETDKLKKLELSEYSFTVIRLK